jgi:polysaccharide biosynthesis/export protein
MAKYADFMAEMRQTKVHMVKQIIRTLLLAMLVGLAPSGCLWGQAGSSADKPAQAAPTNTNEETNKNAEAAKAPAKPHDDTFIIGVDDVLAVNVWKETEVSRSVPVRSDGKISLPLVGEVQAAGETPHQLELAIAKRLQSYISEPEVTVIVQQINSQKFNILGQVTKPGFYSLANSPTVLDALAMAGGFRDFAKKKSIYVLRQNPDGTTARLPFNYKDVIQGKNAAQNVKLQPHDTVYVP